MDETISNAAEPPAPKPRGRPNTPVTDDDRIKVRRMSGMGIPHAQIAIVFGISRKTLAKHYRKELSTAAIESNFKVVESLFYMATEGRNAAAAIFWAKARCGFRTGFASNPDASEPSPASAARRSIAQHSSTPHTTPTLVFANNDGAPLDPS